MLLTKYGTDLHSLDAKAAEGDGVGARGVEENGAGVRGALTVEATPEAVVVSTGITPRSDVNEDGASKRNEGIGGYGSREAASGLCAELPSISLSASTRTAVIDRRGGLAGSSCGQLSHQVEGAVLPQTSTTAGLPASTTAGLPASMTAGLPASTTAGLPASTTAGLPRTTSKTCPSTGLEHISYYNMAIILTYHLL